MKDTSNERTHKDKLVLELVNKMDVWLHNLTETNDLYLSDVRDMGKLQTRLISQFNVCREGEFSADGKLMDSPYASFAFAESPSSFESMYKKNKKDN